MSVHLEVLALQSIHRIARRCGVEVNLPSFFELYGASPEVFSTVLANLRTIVRKLIDAGYVTWWDVYLESDIGRERMLIAEDIGLRSSDAVLDVGCGRGYFTIAAARFAGYVVGVDLMDGFGRYGWWSSFKLAMKLLGLAGRVQGVRCNAVKLPFKDSSFNVVVAVHSLRNFQDTCAIVGALREMKRVVVRGGLVVLVENLPEVRSRRQEIHLKLHSIRVEILGDELPYLSKNELIELVGEVGFRDLEVEVRDYGLCSTPVIFHVDEGKLSGLEEELVGEYRRAIELVRVFGECSTPIAILKAWK